MEQQVQASILQMAKGAIMEQADIEVGKIIQNILDVNTDPSKKRQLTLTVEFAPNADRTQVTIKATAKCKLQPNNAIQTALYVGANPATGELIATELVPNIPGQFDVNGGEQESPKILKFAVGGNY